MIAVSTTTSSSSSTTTSCPTSPKPRSRKRKLAVCVAGDAELACNASESLQASILDVSATQLKRIKSSRTINLESISPKDVGPVQVPLEKQVCNVLSNYVVFNLVCNNELSHFGAIKREFFDKRSIGHSCKSARASKHDLSYLQTQQFVYNKPVKSLYLNWVDPHGVRRNLSPSEAEPVLFDWYRELVQQSSEFQQLVKEMQAGKTIVISGPTVDVISPRLRKNVAWSDADPLSLFCWEQVIVDLLRQYKNEEPPTAC